MPKSLPRAFAFPLATDPDESPAGPAWTRLVVPPGIRDDDEAFDAWLEARDRAHAAADAAIIATLDACDELITEGRELVRVIAGKPSETC